MTQAATEPVQRSGRPVHYSSIGCSSPLRSLCTRSLSSAVMRSSLRHLSHINSPGIPSREVSTRKDFADTFVLPSSQLFKTSALKSLARSLGARPDLVLSLQDSTQGSCVGPTSGNGVTGLERSGAALRTVVSRSVLPSSQLQLMCPRWRSSPVSIARVLT